MFKYLFSIKRDKFNTLKSRYYNNSGNNVYNEQLYNLSKVGYIKHYPPIIRVWNNSIYNYNKNNNDDSLTKYNTLNKIINSYFNMHNNIKLARSKRMRYLRIKSISKRLYVSRPEIKQTNDKIIITVYYFDKIKHRFTRKNFFFNRPDIVKYILNKRYRNKIYRKKTLIRKTKLLEKRIRFLGIKQMKELKSFKDRNKFKNKYVEQSLLFYFFKYVLSLLNVQIHNPICFSKNVLKKANVYKYMNLILKKESIKINDIINMNPKILFWINFNSYYIEKIENKNINYTYLITKVINENNRFLNKLSKHNNSLTKINFITEVNNKLFTIINSYNINNILPKWMVNKVYNFISLKVYRNFATKMFHKQYNKIYRLTHQSMTNIIKFKSLLPALKMVIDTFYNKKTELNMVNLKYFYLNSDIFAQTLITKLKRKLSPTRVIKKSLSRAKIFLNHNIRKQTILNNMSKLSEYSDLSLNTFPINEIQNGLEQKNQKYDILQNIFNKLFPHNFMEQYNKKDGIFVKRITSVLNTIKYKGILGVRVEAKGRLTRRHKAARSILLVSYKGNLKDNDWYYNHQENFERSRPTTLLRNDIRANTQYISTSSIRRIGSFGIKTWISAK